MPRSQETFLPLQPRNVDKVCPSCGTNYIGGGCPNGCTQKGVAKNPDEEITKKIVDDSDLYKGG